jgi:hypothetical protein
MHSIAQTKGSILLYGAVGYTDSKSNYGIYNTNTSKSFEFNPGIGYQFSDKWTAGADFAYSYDENSAGGNGKTEGINIGPFLRYTHQLNGIFYIYGQVNAGFYHTNPQRNEPKSNGFLGKMFPALFVNIKNGFGLNIDFGGIEYQTKKFKDIPYYNSKSFAFSFGKNISIGISKNFGGRKK